VSRIRQVSDVSPIGSHTSRGCLKTTGDDLRIDHISTSSDGQQFTNRHSRLLSQRPHLAAIYEPPQTPLFGSSPDLGKHRCWHSRLDPPRQRTNVERPHSRVVAFGGY
jgi:hypothetical protein